MTSQTITRTPGRTCTPAARVTKSLLGYGVLAGVVFEASILIQGATRHGFRLAHLYRRTDPATDAGGR
jgi:hypothetical protein